MPPLILNDHPLAELAAALEPFGIAAAAAPRLYARVHGRGVPPEPPLDDLGLPRVALEALASAGARSGRIEVLARRRSAADGFVKYLLRLRDGARVEAVLIPLPAGPDTVPEKHVLCVSCQTGCALGCAFCATGRLGAGRNLEPWEIVEQVARARDEAPAPVRGVVFMGMGEPFLNYEACLRAAAILSEPAGFAIGQKNITISTAGVVPGIERFTAEGHGYRLAVSLHSAIEAKRRALMPIAHRWPLDQVLEAAAAHARARRERITLEYVMISGVNVGEEDARALVARLASMKVRLNLIDVNDSSGRHQPPTPEELARFRAWLEPLRQPVVRRYSGGKDVGGACGMLVASADG